MGPLEYRFKPFTVSLKEKNQSPKDRPFPKLDHNIACNDDYLFTYACGHALNPFFTNCVGNLRSVSFTLLTVVKNYNFKFSYF